jgi:hypothetical protein
MGSKPIASGQNPCEVGANHLLEDSQNVGWVERSDDPPFFSNSRWVFADYIEKMIRPAGAIRSLDACRVRKFKSL